MRWIPLAFIALTACNAPRPEPGIRVVTQREVVEVAKPCPVTPPARPAPLPRPLPTDAVALAAVLGAKVVELMGDGGYVDRSQEALAICTKP
jgi:hypothetical protein